MANLCKQCGKKTKNKVFCDINCKAMWQRDQKPVSKEWLYQKYIVEEIGTYEIAKMVNRDPKRVYEWLIDYGIPTRPRGHNYKNNSAFCFWDSDFNNPFQGKRHTPESIEKMSKSSKGPAPWLRGAVHHLFGKRGAEIPTWKGGITPERQAFNASPEWKKAAKTVWNRDNATCQRCGKYKGDHRGVQFDIHHIVGFVNKKLRAQPSNLVLVCRPCHLWIHSKENVNNDFIKEEK